MQQMRDNLAQMTVGMEDEEEGDGMDQSFFAASASTQDIEMEHLAEEERGQQEKVQKSQQEQLNSLLRAQAFNGCFDLGNGPIWRTWTMLRIQCYGHRAFGILLLLLLF